MGRLLPMSLLLALLSLPPPPAAPEPPRQRFADRVEVAEVVVHAVVTDGAGRPVLGLEPADFVILEEGHRVEVTSAATRTPSSGRSAGR